MHDDEDLTLNAKAIGLAVGGATLAATLFLLARRDKEETPAERVRSAVEETRRDAGKAGKKKRRELEAATDRVQEDAKTAERELKAAAWDAQQQAREAEHRLLAAGHRVVDDAGQLASKFGSEARHLADEGRERLAHLRHREGAVPSLDDEVDRLRAELRDLRQQLDRGGGKPASADVSGITSRLAAKGVPISDAMVSQAAAAALAQLERALKAKAPALLAARNRGQVLEILQQELGPTLRDTITQAATAAMSQWEAAREKSHDGDEVRNRAREAAASVEDAAREAEKTARVKADEARAAAAEAAAAVKANGKHRFWRGHHDTTESIADAREAAEQAAAEAAHAAERDDEARRGSAGLLWGGAGIGLALYALMDPERREQVLRLANEASVQLKELVRDLQGYDDEF